MTRCRQNNELLIFGPKSGAAIAAPAAAVPTPMLRALYVAIIRLHLEYGVPVWDLHSYKGQCRGLLQKYVKIME